MKSTVCFSQYFVNKLNVRSYGNILKSGLLKNENKAQLFEHIFKDLQYLISNDLSYIIVEMKTNLKIIARDDFKSYYKTFTIENKTNLNPADKQLVYKETLKLIERIIPMSFYGCNHNLKIFRRIVKLVMFSMYRQFLLLTPVLDKWNFSVKPWNSMTKEVSEQILNNVVFWILKHILCAIICLNFYVTTTKIDNDEYKLVFFIKSKWQSYYDTNILKLLHCKVIRKCLPYSSGKKVRKNYCKTERLKLKKFKKEIPKLHFILKHNNNCRPIVRYKSNQKNSHEKYKVKSKLSFIKEITQKQQDKLESQYGEIYRQWICKGSPKLYFVKADLSNAFGAINKKKLIEIINKKYNSYQKLEQNFHMTQKNAHHYKEIMNELQQPMMIRAGSTVYEWCKGLIQGYKYSPALSELYYTYLDEIYFEKLLSKPYNEAMLFVRIVDDYLFITDSLDSAHEFLNALSNYKNVNYEKTAVNFDHPNIKYSNEIVFLGYKYNTQTLQVSRAKNVYTGQMCYKIAMTPAIGNLSKFIENRIGQSGIPINGHLFNFYHNTEENVWEHIFTTFCLSANKFCTILSLLSHDDMAHYLPIYEQKVSVKLSIAIIDTLNYNKPNDFMFLYCINHFKFLSFKALLLCARNTARCDELITYINTKLSKCQCIYGKWREHASKFECNGQMKKSAVKEICRRTDYRIIFKRMETLPDGFQCYNNKYLK